MTARIKAQTEIQKAQIEAATAIEVARLRAGLDHDATLRGQALAAAQALQASASGQGAGPTG